MDEDQLCNEDPPTRESCSVAKFVSLLPETYRKNYVVVTKSESTQSASVTEPRILMKGLSAAHVFAFTGNMDQQNVEIISWNGVNGWEFRNVEFSGSDECRSMSVSEKNPESCTGCHTHRPKPNWLEYPIWPGTIGEEDDTSDEEDQWMLDFITWGNNNERYAKLNRQGNYDLVTGDDFLNSPSFELHSEFGSQNTIRLLYFIQHSPQYECMKYGFLAALSNCGAVDLTIDPATGTYDANTFRRPDNEAGIIDYLPDATCWFGGDADLWKQVRDSTRNHYTHINERHQLNIDPGETNELVVSNLRYMLEKNGYPGGYDMTGWGIDSQNNPPVGTVERYFLASTYVMFDNLASELAEDLSVPYNASVMRKQLAMADKHPPAYEPYRMTAADKIAIKSYCAAVKEAAIEHACTCPPEGM